MIIKCKPVSLIYKYFIPFIYFSICLLWQIRPQCQNLIVDGSFENLIDNSCNTPDQSFGRLAEWYVLDATPDIFVSKCPFDETEFVFWDEDTEAYEGSNYVGLWSRWNSNGTYFSEGIAGRFSSPLIGGQSYVFQIAIENKGGFEGLDGSVTGCSLMPEKHIDLFLSTDSIRIINNFSNGSASTTAQLVGILNSVNIKGGETEGWKIVSTCFTASGGEEFIGLVMPLGTFGPLPECAAMAISGVFRSFYYHLDAASLSLLPEIISTEIEKCHEESVDVNVYDLFDYDFLDAAVFIWEDGFEGAERRILDKRDYNIIAVLTCGEIILNLEIIEKDCSNGVYVPNAFSPNADGRNDALIVSIANMDLLSNFTVTVYDRWGGVMYTTSDPSSGWDGKKGGKQVAPGTYILQILYEVNSNTGLEEFRINKAILLLR